MRWILIGVVLPALLSCCHTTFARVPTGHKALVVVVQRMSLADIQDPALKVVPLMLQRSAIGLVSPNCAGPKNVYSILLTAATGVTCRSNGSLAEFSRGSDILPSSLTAAKEFELRTGRKATSDAGVLLGISGVMAENAKLFKPAPVGVLADAIHASGGRVCALENSDLSYMPDRSAAVLCMDSSGKIDIADFGPVYDASIDPCTRISSLDANKTIASASKNLGKADLVVLQLGHFAQLDDVKTLLSDLAYAKARRNILRDFDTTLAGLTKLRAQYPGLKIIVVSFCPPAALQWNELTPILIYPTSKPCVLTSASTRTPGLLAAGDFGPTLLSILGVAIPDTMVGRPAQTVPNGSPLSVVDDIRSRVAAEVVLIRPILFSIAGVGALALTLASIILCFSIRTKPFVAILLRWALLFGVISPAAMLLAVLAGGGVARYTVGFVVSSALVLIVTSLSAQILERGGWKFARPIVAAFIITYVLIAVDAMTGGLLCKYSIPSSYQMAGLRYYGIGNEYAAVLIAMSSLAVVFASESKRVAKFVIPLVGVVVLAALGGGGFGANFGATVAVVTTFGLIWRAKVRGGFSFRHIVFFVALGFVVIFGLSLLDAHLFGTMGSHGAHATELATKLGSGYLIGLVFRKVFINLSIIGSSQAGVIVAIFVPFLALWFYGIQSKVERMLGEYENAKAGLKAVLWGAVAAFLFNDSGFVMTSIMLAMMAAFLMYALLERESC